MNLDKFKEFMNADWKQLAVEQWGKISSIDKKSFLWIFIIVNMVFIWHTITFFWGNHDWAQIKYGIFVGWSLFDGRWGAGLIQQLTGGDILPVWNNLFCFTGFTLAVIFLAKYWDLPKNTFIYTIFGTFIILLPYTTPWMTFVRSETHFWNMFLIVISLILCTYKKIWAYIIAILLFYFCMGCYASMLPAILVIFIGRCILDVWFENKTLAQGIKDHFGTALAIILSFGLFLVTWILIKKYYPYFIDFITVNTVTFERLIYNFMHIGKGLRDTFFNAMPYIPTKFKILLGLAIPMTVCLMFKLSKKRILMLCILYITLLIASQTTNLLSVEDYTNMLRIDFFSMPYIYALFWAILLRTGKCWENLAILFMCIAIFYSGLQNLRDQKVKYLDKQRDTKIYENIITRVKNNPKFNPNKQYKLIVIGEVGGYRELTTFDIYNKKMNYANAWSPFIPSWSAKEFFDFNEKESYIEKSLCVNADYLPDDILKEMDSNFILNIAELYPSLNSVYIDDKFIYVILDDFYLDMIRKRIRGLYQINSLRK